MRSLIRFGATLGLVGSTLAASWLAPTLKVLALTQEEIVKVLQPVPVFTIADEKGAPLVAVGEDKEKVTGVFISQQDAKEFFQQLQQQNPDLAKQVKVQPVSLGEVYKLAAANAEKSDGLNFAYVPMEGEVDSAKQLLGDKYQGGVPLFVARGGPEKGYLTIQQNNDQVIPFFFEKSQILEMVERFKKEKPDLAATVSIEVVPLENMIVTLQQSNDEALKQIRLIPSQETMQFIRAAIQQQQNQANPSQK